MIPASVLTGLHCPVHDPPIDHVLQLFGVGFHINGPEIP